MRRKKSSQANAGIVMWWFRAVPLSIFIFKSLSIMLGFMDLMWPRVFRRSNVGLVIHALPVVNNVP